MSVAVPKNHPHPLAEPLIGIDSYFPVFTQMGHQYRRGDDSKEHTYNVSHYLTVVVGQYV